MKKMRKTEKNAWCIQHNRLTSSILVIIIILIICFIETSQKVCRNSGHLIVAICTWCHVTVLV